jgi:hypothetical protein
MKTLTVCYNSLSTLHQRNQEQIGCLCEPRENRTTAVDRFQYFPTKYSVPFSKIVATKYLCIGYIGRSTISITKSREKKRFAPGQLQIASLSPGNPERIQVFFNAENPRLSTSGTVRNCMK